MKRIAYFAALLALAGCAHAQTTFNKYAPAAGIQKNTGATYVDTAAVASDVINLFSGTQDAAHCLSGAATLVSCTGGGGSPGGASNSVQYNNGGTFGGVSLVADQVVQGTAGAPQALSLVNCGSTTQALAYSTSTHTFSCQTVNGTGGTPANPTASLGLTAVNGSASTFMRSDAAPALSQSIAPTWTGAHTFTPASGLNGTVFNSAPAVNFAAPATFQANNITDMSQGPVINAGTTINDIAFIVNDVTGMNPAFSVWGDGSVAVGVPGLFGPGTFNAQNGLYQNGRKVPNTIWAQVTGIGAGCTVNDSDGVTGSCTRNSAGNYTLTATSAFGGSAAACTASTAHGATPIAAQADIVSTTITVITLASGGSPSDGSFSLTCMGH